MRISDWSSDVCSSDLSTRSFSPWGHRSGGGLMKMFKIACRIAGMLGCGGGPPTLFFPPRCFETDGLKERVCDHCHHCITMYSNPGAAFEMIEAQFFKDGRGAGSERVGQVVCISLVTE